jgi:phosphoglycolate phosphatase-like HAD superfamily hydrolase
LSKLLKSENSIDWFISDSPGDIEAGKKLGIKTCSVGTGFRSNETLAKYFAELNIDSILNFPTELLSAKI